MAQGITQQELGVFLGEICETLKRHEQQIFDLTCEAEGLKATSTGHDRQYYEQEKKKAVGERGDDLASRIRSLDAIAARIRSIGPSL
jgi:hypothetical protein